MLGRSGVSTPTREHLRFKLAHAQARDAVDSTWDWKTLHQTLLEQKEQVWTVQSQVKSKTEFLARPDLGRKLAHSSYTELIENSKNLHRTPTSVVFIVSDGLSALAIERHWLPFWNLFRSHFSSDQVQHPIVLAPMSRVAISDEIGAAFQAQLSVIFIGERPGLSSIDSLGIYLTYNPKPGTQDSSRNCISNVRPPDGLSYPAGARKLHFLIQESLKRKLSGIQLKDDSIQNISLSER